MNGVRPYFPSGPEPVDVNTVIAGLDGVHLRPFDQSVLTLFRELARRINRSKAAGRHPDLQALAYWLRPSAMTRWKRSYDALSSPEVIRVPRGCVFHLPPGNVDLQFVYGWVFALLQGNTNLIRLSGRASGAALEVCRILNEIAGDLPELNAARHTVIFGYDHDDTVGERLSASVDVRVIWGGDATVKRIRKIPLSPRADDVVFPDRSSLCLIGAKAFLTLEETFAMQLVEAFFNDTYFFDQLACASPRLLIWFGSETETERAADDFFRRLAAVVKAKGYSLGTGISVERKLFAARAVLDHPVSAVKDFGPATTVVTLESSSDVRGAFCGGGFFFQVRIEDLSELVPELRGQDQTLTAFGFSQEHLRKLVRDAGANSVHRIVPIGKALEFGRYWDGHDLLTVFSRLVPVDNTVGVPGTNPGFSPG